MDTRKCAECGAEFTTNRANQLYCSHDCQHSAAQSRYRRKSARHEAAIMWDVSAPVPLDRLMRAAEKPPNTSAVRWRIELRRRANPDYYAAVGM